METRKADEKLTLFIMPGTVQLISSFLACEIQIGNFSCFPLNELKFNYSEKITMLKGKWVRFWCI